MAATIATRMTERAYRALALTEAGKLTELWDGEPREKPAMSIGHGWSMSKLGYDLMRQLDWNSYQVRVNSGRARVTSETYFIPDVLVIPTAFVRELGDVRSLDAYDRPLPLVVEVWSPSTGGYDVAEKLAGYQARGDAEIWSLHPYERTLTVWRRQSDGGYTETVYREGVVRPSSLPGVVIDLAELFED